MEKQTIQLPFNKKFQAGLIVAMIKDYDFYRNISDDLLPSYLDAGQAHIKLLKIVKSKASLYKKPLTIDIIRNSLIALEKEGVFTEPEIAGINAVIDTGLGLTLSESAYVKREAFEFLKKQVVAKAVSESIVYLEENKLDEVYMAITEAYKKTYGIGENIGYDYKNSSISDRYSEPPRKGIWSSGFAKLDQYIDGGFASSEAYTVISPTGRGKCLGINTPIIMSDGTTKMVQDVVMGDKLIGPDGKSRNILSTIKGYGKLFKIIPTKGEPYIVNDVHLLSLKLTKGTDNINLSNGTQIKSGTTKPVFVEAEVLYNSNKTTKHCLKGWYPEAINFENETTSHIIPPYILGVWLGDGHSDDSSISQLNNEVAAEFWKYAKSIGNKINMMVGNGCPEWRIIADTKKNSFRKALKTLNVFNNKHIPQEYIITTKEARLELLAGLIDTDGSLHYSGYDIIQKNKQIADSIVFIAKSLGFYANISKCQKGIKSSDFIGDYWRVNISGNCDIIPVKIIKKKAQPRKQKKNHLLTGITIEPAGYGDYYGFEIDGDKQFLLGDWQVTHNTALLCNFGVTALEQKKKCLFITLEMREGQIAQRQDSILCGFSATEIANNREYQMILDQQIQNKITGENFIKGFNRGSLSMGAFRTYLDRFCNDMWKPDVLIFDWLGCVKLTGGKDAKKHEQLAEVADDFINLTRDYDLTGISAHQSNRSAVSQDVFAYDVVSESFASLFGMDLVLGLGATNEAKDAGKRTLSILKSRMGPDSVYTKLMGDLPGKPLTFRFKESLIDDDEEKELLEESK